MTTLILRAHILGITLKQIYVLGSMDGPRDTLNRRSRFLEKIEGLA
ncbi:MAG: hypothetical protein Q4G21_09590 [Dermabacter sp.]|nr:hypothetical protein [Dermabacter sp.]